MKRGHSSTRHISHRSGLHSPQMIMKWHAYHKGPLVMGIHLLGVGWRCERAWANLTVTVPDWSCLPFTPFPQSCSGSRYSVSWEHGKILCWTHISPDVAQLSKSHTDYLICPQNLLSFQGCVFSCLKVQKKIVLIKTEKGPTQFCFHQRGCQNCSEEEQDLHPTHPVHLTISSGQNKIRKLVVIGFVSSHNIFSSHQD